MGKNFRTTDKNISLNPLKMLIKLDTFLLIHVFNTNFSKKFYKKEKKSICGCFLSMNDEFWANGFKLYGPHIFFTIHFGKTPEIYSCWASIVSSWRLILISYNHSSFIFLVNAYRLGLWIFFHSLIKFFIEGKKKRVIYLIAFYLSKY